MSPVTVSVSFFYEFKIEGTLLIRFGVGPLSPELWIGTLTIAILFYEDLH